MRCCIALALVLVTSLATVAPGAVLTDVTFSTGACAPHDNHCTV